MNCEICNVEHDGSYGSGRFCSQKCARSFSTKRNREVISRKVSQTMKGRPPVGGKPFQEGYDPRRKILTDDDRLQAVEALGRIRKYKYLKMDWLDLPESEQRRRILAEQEYKCDSCHLDEWMGLDIPLELHHIDGDKTNNKRDNLRIICLNCHGQTPNYRNKTRLI